MDTIVECYSGDLYAEEPRSLAWHEKEYEVESIERAWQEPGNRLFRVVTEDGKLFELCCSQTFGRWCAVESTDTDS